MSHRESLDPGWGTNYRLVFREPFLARKARLREIGDPEARPPASGNPKF